MKVPRRLLPLSVIACLAASAAPAQRVSTTSGSGPAVIHSLHSATIPPIVGVIANSLAPMSAGPVACAATCLESAVTVRANTRWQLQVTLRQPLEKATIEWIEPGIQTGRPLTPGASLIVASGDEPALQHSVTLSFVVRDDAGGPIVDPSLVAELLSYRVVPRP